MPLTRPSDHLFQLKDKAKKKKSKLDEEEAKKTARKKAQEEVSFLKKKAADMAALRVSSTRSPSPPSRSRLS